MISTRGVVASEHPLASQAGAMILAGGGHAVDAAIAANAVMGVVCPMMCGVGGDLFAIVQEANGPLHGINASGWAPAALTPDVLEARGISSMPQSGAHSVTVPGAVGGWALLSERFGRTPLARVLEAATALAEDGFPVAEITSEEWHIQESFLRGDPEAARTFLPEAQPLSAGEIRVASRWERVAEPIGAASPTYAVTMARSTARWRGVRSFNTAPKLTQAPARRSTRRRCRPASSRGV